MFPDLQQAVSALPPGRYAVGVSGGADSVAMLTLLRHHRPELQAHVVHLDHEFRPDSPADARFVSDLARRLGMACTVARRSEVERSRDVPPPRNSEARGRAARLALFQQIVDRERLDGVVLAHHADDQAETILLRLLRGSGFRTLGGMSPRARVGSMLLHRPLLGIGRQRLRDWLASIGQAYREDSTNREMRFARNRVRRVLGGRDELRDALLKLGGASRSWSQWIERQSPSLGPEFRARALASLCRPLAERSAGRWLVGVAGCPPEECDAATVDRLIAMAGDAATPARSHFPGGAMIRRRGGAISVVQRGRWTRHAPREPGRDER